MNAIAFIGEAAFECLKQDQSGVIDSVFERSAYIDFTGTYLCITLSDVGRGPLNIVYDTNTRLLHPALNKGVPITFSALGQTLRINDQVVAVMHHARLTHDTMMSTHPDLSVLIARQRSMVFLRAPKSGLLPLVVALRDNTHGRSNAGCEDLENHDQGSIDSAFKRFSTPLLQALIIWLDQAMRGARVEQEPAESIKKLLGAGPGLTPSGDDLLAGVLLALRISGQLNALQQLWEHLEPAISYRTNRISAALLYQAAQGRAGEFALTAIQMYISTNDLNESDLSRVLTCMGETSGWDMFAGVLLVFDAQVNAGFSNPVRIIRQAPALECSN